MIRFYRDEERLRKRNGDRVYSSERYDGPGLLRIVQKFTQKTEQRQHHLIVHLQWMAVRKRLTL